MPSAPLLTLELRRSRSERIVATFLIAAAGVALATASWTLPVRVLAVAVFALAVLGTWRWSMRRPVPLAVECRSDGSWWLHERSASGERRVAAVQLRAHRMTGPVIALNFAFANASGAARLPRRRSVVLWPDSADADALRRLRIRLSRLHGTHGNSRQPDAVG